MSLETSTHEKLYAERGNVKRQKKLLQQQHTQNRITSWTKLQKGFLHWKLRNQSWKWISDYQLISQHQNCFEWKFIPTEEKEVFKTRSEKFNNKNIAVSISTTPFHSWNTTLNSIITMWNQNLLTKYMETVARAFGLSNTQLCFC